MEHEFKVDSPIVIDRILSRNLGKWSKDLRNEIIPDTTPVPFFGDFENATIISIGINPSSEEFPSLINKRRLCHLSDLKQPIDYYKEGLTAMTSEEAIRISKSLLNYFEINPYKDWFDLAETAINGAGATFYKNKEKSSNFKIACHVDLFPWATKAYSRLDSSVQKELKLENSEFMMHFIESERVEKVIFFGNDSKNGCKDAAEYLGIELGIKKIKSIKGRFGVTFEVGDFEVAGNSKRYFLTTSGPSARTKGDKFTELNKNEVHISFAKFIQEWSY